MGIPCGRLDVDDYAFFEALLEWASSNLCVDLSRVFITGFSTGGFLANDLACRYPRNVTAIATNAGLLGKNALAKCAVSWPADAQLVGFQSFHSHADPTVPYDGNVDWASQPEVDATWRSLLKLNDAPNVTSYESATSKCVAFGGSDATFVEFCTVENLDHCWIGGRSGGFASCEKRPGDVSTTERAFAYWATL